MQRISRIRKAPRSRTSVARLPSVLAAAAFAVLAIGAAAAEGEAPADTDGSQKPLASLTELVPSLTPVSDYTGDFWNRYTLIGDIGGRRQQLYDRGFAFDATFTQVYQGVVSGGADDGADAYHGLFEYGIALDSGKLGLWPGGLVVANAYSSVGNTLIADTGNLSPVNFNSLLPTPDPSETFLMEYYLTQALPTKTLVTIGRLNAANFLDRSRFANDRRSQFLNAGVDNNLIVGSFISFSSYAVLAVQPVNEHLAVYAAVWDPTAAPTDYGVPGGLLSDVGTGGGADIRWKLGDRLDGSFNPVFLYSSKDTAEVDNPYLPFGPLVDLVIPIDAPSRSDNWGVIATFDQYLWKPEPTAKHPPAGPARPQPPADFAFQEPGVGLAFRFGYVPEDGSPFNVYVSGGIGARGVIPCRPYDRMGIGTYALLVSDDFDQLTLLGSLLEDEVGFEAYYNLALTPAVQLSFDLQWIDPGLSTTDDTVVLGTRLFLRF
jgi:porin